MTRRKANTNLIEVDAVSILSPVQQRVLASIIAGRSYVEAASDAGITDRTIRRWRESCPDFEHALRSQVHSVRESATVQVTLALQTAIKSLIEIASNSTHPQAIKAIKMIVDLNGPLQPVRDSVDADHVFQEQGLSLMKRYDALLN
jgi:hypothetical protein